MSYSVYFTKQAQRDAKKIAKTVYKAKLQSLLLLIEKDPFMIPPPYELLVGDFEGACSRRINIQHRLVYQVNQAKKTVKVLSVWTHYE